MSSRLTVTCSLGCLLALTQFIRAGDWPQILGPNRNGKAVDERPIKPWPLAGPKQVWSFELGQGYAGPSVVGERVIVFHRQGSKERVEAVSRSTGKSLWHRDFVASYQGGVNPDGGPRCVPLVHGDSVFVFGAGGDLHCVALKDGKHRWSRAAYQDYSGKEGYFGAGATPIVADEKLIVNVGGKDAGLVAFDLKNGETVWRVADDDASYSSPAVAKIGGTTHVVFVTRFHTVSIDPSDGGERFRFPFGARGPTVNAATPLIWDDYLFVSAAYRVGAQLWRVRAKNATRVWANDEVMSSQYTTCVYRDGHLYGTHGREDFRNGELRCVDAKAGKVVWSFPGTGVAHTILVGERLLLLSVDGSLRLAEANPKAYRELAKTKIVDSITRALPAYSNGQFFVRTSEGDAAQLLCLQLGD